MLNGLLAPGDSWDKNFALRHMVTAQLRAGHIPTWSPVQFGGFPILAVGQYGHWYLPDRLLGFLSPILAFNLGIPLSFSISGLGAFMLGRRFGYSRAGALVTALIFSFGPFMWSELAHPEMLASAAWLPWALLGLEMAQETGRRFAGAVIAGLALAMSVYGGHPQMAAASFLLIVVWAGFRALFIAEFRGRAVAGAVLSLLLGALLAAPQLLPTLKYIGASARGVYPYEQASSMALEGRQLPLVLFPFASGASGGWWGLGMPAGVGAGVPFLGVVGFVLAVGAIPFWRRDRRIVVGWFVAAVVFLAALSPIYPPLGRLVFELPVFSHFRGWGRFTVVGKLPVAVMAGFTVSVIGRGTAADRRVAARWSGGAAIFYLCAAAGLVALPVLTTRVVLGIVVPTAIATSAGGLMALSRRWPRIAVGLVVFLAAIEVFALCRPEFPTFTADAVEPKVVREAMDPATAARFVADEPGGIDRYLAIGTYSGESKSIVYPRAPLTGLSGALSVNGYDPLASQSYLEALGMDFYGQVSDPSCLLRGRSSEQLLDLLRVSTIVAPADSAASRELDAIGEVTPIRGTGWVRLDRSVGLSDAVTLDRSQVGTLNDVAEGGLACGAIDLSGATDLQTRRNGRGEIEVEVVARADQAVIVSEAFSDGWQAELDGVSVDVRPSGPVMAVDVPTGTHRLRLVYNAPGLQLGLLIFGLTVLVLVAAAIHARSRRFAGEARRGLCVQGL